MRPEFIAGAIGQGVNSFMDSYYQAQNMQRQKAESDMNAALRRRQMKLEERNAGVTWDDATNDYKEEPDGFLSRSESQKLNRLIELRKAEGDNWYRKENDPMRSATETLMRKQLGDGGMGPTAQPMTYPQAAPTSSAPGLIKRPAAQVSSPQGALTPKTLQATGLVAQAQPQLSATPQKATASPGLIAPPQAPNTVDQNSPYAELKKKVMSRHAPGYNQSEWGGFIPKAEREQRQKNEEDLLHIAMKEIDSARQATSEADKKKSLAALPADVRLQGESAETKSKIGLIKNALEAEGDYINAANSGGKQRRITPQSGIKVPFMGEIPVGKWLVNSTPIDEARLMMSEGIGRLHSGGAIGAQERTDFESLIPTAADDPDSYARKLDKYSKMMRSKLQTFGYSPEELGISLPQISIPGSQSEKQKAQQSKPLHAEGTILEYQGKKYRIGPDGKTGVPIQ